MALRLAGIGSPGQKIGQLSQKNVSSSENSGSFRPNVTDDSGIVTGDSGHGRKSVTFNQNGRSRSVGTTGHVQSESAVKLPRNTHVDDSNDSDPRGKVSMVIGTPGASRIFTSIFQVLVDVYDFHLTLNDAQKQLRFHHQLLPENVIFNEPWAPFSPELIAALRERGYSVKRQDWNGDIEAIQIVGRQPVPVADPRARGVALTVY
jgi:Gamma-glutamyltranspeptidase